MNSGQVTSLQVEALWLSTVTNNPEEAGTERAGAQGHPRASGVTPCGDSVPALLATRGLGQLSVPLATVLLLSEQGEKGVGRVPCSACRDALL